MTTARESVLAHLRTRTSWLIPVITEIRFSRDKAIKLYYFQDERAMRGDRRYDLLGARPVMYFVATGHIETLSDEYADRFDWPR